MAAATGRTSPPLVTNFPSETGGNVTGGSTDSMLSSGPSFEGKPVSDRNIRSADSVGVLLKQSAYTEKIPPSYAESMGQFGYASSAGATAIQTYKAIIGSRKKQISVISAQGTEQVFSQSDLVKLCGVANNQKHYANVSFNLLNKTFTTDSGKVVCAVGIYLFVFCPKEGAMFFLGYSSGVEKFYDLGEDFLLIASSGNLHTTNIEAVKRFPESNPTLNQCTPRANYIGEKWQLFDLSDINQPTSTIMVYRKPAQPFTATLALNGAISAVKDRYNSAQEMQVTVAEGQTKDPYQIDDKLTVNAGGETVQAQVIERIIKTTPAVQPSWWDRTFSGTQPQEEKTTIESYRLEWQQLGECITANTITGDQCCAATQRYPQEQYVGSLRSGHPRCARWVMVDKNGGLQQCTMPAPKYTEAASGIDEVQKFEQHPIPTPEVGKVATACIISGLQIAAVGEEGKVARYCLNNTQWGFQESTSIGNIAVLAKKANPDASQPRISAIAPTGNAGEFTVTINYFLPGGFESSTTNTVTLPSCIHRTNKINT